MKNIEKYTNTKAALEIVVSDAQRIYNGCGESEVK